MNIFCVGQNFADHAKELGNKVPKEPVFFQKASSCISKSDLIKISSDKIIHHEIELVIIIGNRGSNISIDSAKSYISHWCLGLDLTDRPRQNEMRKKGLPWFDSKSFPGSAVITEPEKINWENIKKDFFLCKNGREIQRGNITDMVFDISTLISKLSQIIIFEKGDLLFTGTPSGVGPISNGDLLELFSEDYLKGTFSVKKT
ncbi:MAG: hypothetical protein CMG75_00050 [Candidatus Marinimicrobia bacterium]|nr:hypothetical protein [Candidatus Neomarinimicrobiota bacterium]